MKKRRQKEEIDEKMEATRMAPGSRGTRWYKVWVIMVCVYVMTLFRAPEGMSRVCKQASRQAGKAAQTFAGQTNIRPLFHSQQRNSLAHSFVVRFCRSD